MADKKNCWEVMGCGRELGGAKAGALGVCPAATDRSADGLNEGSNGGRICWAITGTFCGGKVQGTFAEKELSCLDCRFFKEVKKEQGGDSFCLLKPGQRYMPHEGRVVRAGDGGSQEPSSARSERS
ncbi:MAG: hypothetical protein A3J75_03060 [Acidobacteria bacterium RBG_16_68_9]|nr:MAG: hypothetical protein A3J75_03060 [Acidobacteria bacterium RBG_16_68_9]